MSDLSISELDEIEGRASAATPGPWKSFIEGRHGFGFDSVITTGDEDIYLTGATHADRDFIASARQDVPRRVAEIRALRQKLAVE